MNNANDLLDWMTVALKNRWSSDETYYNDMGVNFFSEEELEEFVEKVYDEEMLCLLIFGKKAGPTLMMIFWKITF